MKHSIRFEMETTHPPFTNARNRMKKKATKMGSVKDLSFTDTLNIVRGDSYYRHISSMAICLELAMDVHESCSLPIPDEYRVAFDRYIKGNGDDFLLLAQQEF